MDSKARTIAMARIWRRLTDSFPPKVILASAISFFVAGFLQKNSGIELEPIDILVYSSIYSSWAVFCLPDILLRFNFRFIRRVLVILLMLYQSELSLTAWNHLRAHVPKLQTTNFNLEALGADLERLQDLVSAFRFILLLTCLSCTVVAYLADWPQVLDEDFADDDDVDIERPSWLFEDDS